MENIRNNDQHALSESIVAAVEYPRLLKRVQSTFIDGIITFSIIGGLVAVGSKINDDAVGLKVIAIVLGLCYEPLTSCFSGTIGQQITRIRVVRDTDGGKITVVQSFIRYVVKCLLGWLSFVVVHFNPKRRAIHDFLSGTVMVFR